MIVQKQMPTSIMAYGLQLLNSSDCAYRMSIGGLSVS